MDYASKMMLLCLGIVLAAVVFEIVNKTLIMPRFQKGIDDARTELRRKASRLSRAGGGPPLAGKPPTPGVRPIVPSLPSENGPAADFPASPLP